MEVSILFLNPQMMVPRNVTVDISLITQDFSSVSLPTQGMMRHRKQCDMRAQRQNFRAKTEGRC
jgi:hypothetical protein